MSTPAWRPLCGAIPAFAVAGLVLLVPGCAAGPAPGAPAAPGSTGAAAASAGSTSGSCTFRASPGSLRGEGGNSRAIVTNGKASMGCGEGPTISLDGVDADAATFALGGERVRVAAGDTAALGPYQVRVLDVQAQTVRLELSAPTS